MNKIEVKKKLKEIIKCMLVSDLETEINIPDPVAHEILKDYGCTVGRKSDEKNSLDAFLIELEKWVENNHQQTDQASRNNAEQVDFLTSLYKEYIEAETEYCNVMSEITKVLEDVLKHKEVYSQYFKDECSTEETSMEVLSKKCYFLKLQFFLKLYGEENALEGHLALKDKLKRELNTLKKQHSELVEYNKKMNNIRKDKTFCELFATFKELKRIEQMTGIIGTI